MDVRLWDFFFSSDFPTSFYVCTWDLCAKLGFAMYKHCKVTDFDYCLWSVTNENVLILWLTSMKWNR